MSRPEVSRRAVLGALALALLAPLPAMASGSKEGAETYVKLPSIVLEFWDENGLFHTVNMDLAAVFPAQASVNKKVAQEITKTLSAMTWEEFSRGNPAATIKSVALDMVRKDPTGATCTEVLVIKLMMR